VVIGGTSLNQSFGQQEAAQNIQHLYNNNPTKRIARLSLDEKI